jgi:phospholipid/cholesterol/gamma-HCH transport system substrate-binding protein
MKEHVKTLLIGLFVVIACCLLIGMILFFKPSVGDGKQRLLVRLSNINGIGIGTRVALAGKPIGDVIAIQQIPEARKQPTDELGQVYFYQLVCQIDSSVQIFNTDEVTVQTSGLLGEKSIALVPKKAPPGVTPKRIAGDEPLYGQSADPFEYAFNELSSLADKMEETLDKVGDWIDENGHAVGSAVRSFDQAMVQVTQTVAEANQQKLVDKVTEATQNFSSLMASANVALDQLQQEDSFTNFGITMRNLKNTSFSVEDIAADVAAGQGTLGKILKGDDLYLQMNAIFTKANTLFNDINQYGLMFNLNKQWQRTRVKRASELSALDSPEQFRSFFSREVDMINTSMERISMLIDRAKQDEGSRNVLATDLFKEDFTQLMRDVNALQDNLKLYNEQWLQAQ